MGALIRWLLVAALVSLAAVALAALMLDRYMAQPLPLQTPLTFEVASGGSLSSVARDLAQEGLLDHPRWFVLYGRIKGHSSRLKAGEYRLEPGLTREDLLSRFVSGDVLLHSLTVVEGWTFRQMLTAMHRHPALRIQTGTMTMTEIAARLGLPTQLPEGWFLPETYLFARGTTDLELLAQGAAAMRQTLERAWQTRAADTRLTTPYEALILASIIERETGLESEREQIAGVMNRRLQRGMRLQTDPTVIYGLGDDFDGNLRRADLERDTPYNTYTRKGLPPTPIALPGASSVFAAVTPAPGDALFFVATGEGDGSHFFSATLEEHNRAVARYLKRLRDRRGARP